MMKIISLVLCKREAILDSRTIVNRLCNGCFVMSSALRDFHDVKSSFHYSVVPASELELKAHVHIKIMYSDLVETTSL